MLHLAKFFNNIAQRRSKPQKLEIGTLSNF